MSDEKILRSMHFLAALALPLLIFAALGCKRAKEEPEDLGPAVDAKSVESVLDEVQQGNTYANGKKDQFTFYEENISAQGSPPKNLGSDFIFVKDRIENPATPDVIKLVMYYDRRKLDDNGTMQSVISEETFNVNLNQTIVNNASPFALSTLQAKATSVQASARPTKPIRITYHRLEVRRGNVMEVPPVVRLRADCGGLPGCAYDAISIQVDQVSWYSDTDYDRLHFDLIYNKTTPYLINLQNEDMNGLMLMGCISTYIPYQGTKVYARNCISLVDFQR